MRFASADQLAQTQIARRKEVQRMAREEHEKFVELMRQEHFALVSGGVSDTTLRALDHPFARRHFAGLDAAVKKTRRKNLMGAANIRLLPINVQTGVLRKSLFMRRGAEDPPVVQTFEVGFSAPHAKYVLARKGTRRMIARQFQETKKKVEKRRTRELAQKIRLGIVRIHAQQLSGGNT